MKVTLFVRAPKKPEKKVVVERDVVIGRGKDCNLQVLSNDVSRRHCQFVIGDNDVFVRDLGSGNGTLINGEQTQPNVDEALISGDIVRIGPLVIKVEFESVPVVDVDAPGNPSTDSTERAAADELTADQPVVPQTDSEPTADQFLEPADDELLPDDEGDVDDFSEAAPELLPADEPEPELLESASGDESPGKMKSLFGLFGRKKKGEEIADDNAVSNSNEQPTSVAAEPEPEPLLVAENASFEEETVVVAPENAFTSDDGDMELLADDEEGLSDEGDYLDDEVQDEAVDPGFADFLNNVDQPPT